ncbi:MAG TPA: thrombospondin type 3 repeat-containing protein [Candidatus Eisenbacteria bacterium]|jgi:outer membrane protein OmpA-like peptidoglycan-associated protein
MTVFPSRFASALLAATALLLLAAPNAPAVEERAWLTLEAGGDFYDPEQQLRDHAGFGLRATGFLNRWLGIEGMLHTSSPVRDPESLGGGTFRHYAGGILLTPDRHQWVLPYLYGGIGAAHAGYDNGPSSTKGALHAGGGILVRAGERLGFRLDARDVSYRQDGGPGRDTRVNTMLITGGLTATWFGRPRDTDEDAVPDKRDRCPGTPAGAVVDAGGCPVDSDGDRVYDGLDKCPGTPRGAVVDAGGCPIDSDADGVPDGIDRCPETVKGVIVDAAGCGVDSDGDGVFDGLDPCADTPKGARVDSTGCPQDADGDGIPDGIDTCPATPAGVAVNAGGCPIVPSFYESQLRDGWQMTLTDLQFAPDSARILPEGMARLDSIGVVLEQWPMLRFEIGVHSDNEGEHDRRFQLTRFRGRAIVQYLTSRFPSLNSKNYWFTGYGDSEPLASNAAKAGRAVNRRIEFKLLNAYEYARERDRRMSFGDTPAPPAPGLEPKPPSPPQEGTTPEQQ